MTQKPPVHFAFIVGTALTLLWLEQTNRLRASQRESKLLRDVRNLVIAGAAAVVMSLVEAPLAKALARKTRREGLGLVPMLTANPLVGTALGVIFLDYGLYVWHVLTHKVPFLWRFHLVHHTDLDLDASTALRFHFGEMILSVPWRLFQIRVVGASPEALSLWQTLLFASILFHHSNVRVPAAVERWLSWLIVTPRLHDIHHRADAANTNANWSSGLACWDLLHGTRRTAGSAVPIGVPAWQDPEDATLARCASIPFSRQRDDWSPAHKSAAHGQDIGRNLS